MAKDLEKIQKFVTKKCLERFNVNLFNHILPIWNLNLTVILNALNHDALNGKECYISWDYTNPGHILIMAKTHTHPRVEWKLMTDYGSEILFEGQSEQTQLETAKLLGYKE